MRMWGVEPKLLCRKHLLGEHVEMHMFIGTIYRGLKIYPDDVVKQHGMFKGYLNHQLVIVDQIVDRHDAIRDEMVTRGMNHQSPMGLNELSLLWDAGDLDIEYNLRDLVTRCSECAKLILDEYGPIKRLGPPEWY